MDQSDKKTVELNDGLIAELIDTALAQRHISYAPYSNYCVGAALLTRDGTVYTGCNIENAAYGPSICAERTAFCKAVSEGARDFEAICIAGGKKGENPSGYSMPCGVCRQVMREFCGPAFRVIVAVDREHYAVYTLEQLLPEGFGAEHIV